MSLKVENLKISIKGTSLAPVKNIFFTVKKGERVALVGESGSGKSLSAFAVLKLLPENLEVSGTVSVDGTDVLTLKGEKLRKFRWKKVSLVFQDPSSALNPLLKVKEQIGEAIENHFPGLSKKEVEERVVELLKMAKVPQPEKRKESYPHHLSGGLKQRICIAMALACEPSYLLADEPTTALDVTVQKGILDLLLEVSEGKKTGILLITHDMGVVSEFSQKVYVAYAGYTVECGKTEEVLKEPLHPYTLALIRCFPTFKGRSKEKLFSIPGSIPSLEEKIKGCPFHPRCPERKKICEEEFPPQKWVGDRFVLCHLR